MKLLTLSFLLILGAATLQKDSQPHVLMKAPAPQPESIAGYDRAHCVSHHHQIRVCKVISADADVFFVEQYGKRIGVWPASTPMNDTSDFEVLSADFEHDGRAELIFANHDGTSNGLGVNYWTITIFPDELKPGVEPVTFSVEEYGSFGTFVTDRDMYVNILSTSWKGATDPKGKRGDGLYLVGQWWRYRSGQLVPHTKRTTVARRYLNSFEKERWETIDSGQAPFRWFRNAKAETFTPDQITGPALLSESGVIAEVSAVTKTGSQRTVKISFRRDTGATVAYTYPKVDDEGDGDISLDYIGDTASGRIYPLRYFPSHIEAWLKGKRATLRTYGAFSRTEMILWLDR